MNLDLTPSMTAILVAIGDRSATAHDIQINGCAFKRLVELGFLKVDLPKEGRFPPYYSLSEMGKGAAAILTRIPAPTDREGAVAKIKRTVASHYHIPLHEMVSARRSRGVARPRQVAMYLSKQLTPKSLPAIGRLFGNRDHTTVIHAVKKVESLIAADRGFASTIETLKAEAA